MRVGQCPGCGKVMRAGDTKCPDCGTFARPTRSSKVGLIVAIIILGIFVFTYIAGFINDQREAGEVAREAERDRIMQQRAESQR